MELAQKVEITLNRMEKIPEMRPTVLGVRVSMDGLRELMRKAIAKGLREGDAVDYVIEDTVLRIIPLTCTE